MHARSCLSTILLVLTTLAATSADSFVPIRLETVDSSLGPDPSSTAIAVTPEGKPCIAYVENGGTLAYAVYNHPNWSTEIISSGGGTYSNVSLSLDPQGNPVVAAGLFQNIFVYVKNGGDWDIVFSGDVASWDPTVRHDYAGNLHVAYVHQYTGPWTIRYATNESGSWVTETVDYYAYFQQSNIRQVALALDQTGQPGIAWRDEYGHLQYSWNSSGWATQQVSSLNASHISLVIGVGQIPHIAFFESGNDDLVYATGPVFSWTTTVIDVTGRVGFDTSITLDSGDKPHISYFDDETDHISYKYLVGSTWYGQIIESPGAVGWETSIALDAYDNIHFSYLDQGEDQLRYAVSQDCNGNGEDDHSDIDDGTLDDCDNNGIADGCEIAMGFTDDCNDNEVPDDCEEDCNNNGVPDECDIDDGTSDDCNFNGVPDECEVDCNENGIPDECDIDSGYSEDCNRNDVPDECDFASGTSLDCNDNGIPDECDITYGGMPDCDTNGVPDECDFASGDPVDCNNNQEIDLCELPEAWHVGGHEYGWFGWAIASGDFDADGFTDIAVGQPTWSNKGRVHIFYGGDPMDTVADEVMTWNISGSLYGRSLATGNINGDVYDDLVIGIPGYSDGVGDVIVFVGTAEADLTYETSWAGYQYHSNFGASVALADVTGDGLDDIIVGAPSQVTNQDPGHVYVYDATHMGGNPIETWDGYENDDDFGSSVANAGDVDGNGRDDVIVGTSFYGNYNADFVGYARLFLSQPDGMVEGPALGTGVAGDLYGYAVNSAGDLNDDGYDDFVVTAPYSGVLGDRPGRAFLYFGSETPDGVADLVFVGAQHLANLGSAVAPVGDVNDDGFPDLIIGSDHLHHGTEYSWADLFMGGPHLDTEPDKRIFSDDNGFGMGFAVASGGDTNGDGVQEVLVSNPQHSSSEFFEGRVSIVQLDLPDFGDCNLNGIADFCDIASGFSSDVNQNGIPDECDGISSVEDSEPRLRTQLLGAYPTPFNPRTELRFELAADASVHLRVFDISGKLIRTLARGLVYEAGRYALTWQGRDDAGQQVASGVYFYRLEAGAYVETKRMTLIR